MSLADLLYANPFYRLSLAGPSPQRLRHLPPPAWLGDPARGNSIATGTLRCAGETVAMKPSTWKALERRPEILATLHGFGWLDDLAATGSSRATEVARSLVDEWIGEYSRWQPMAWAPPVLGSRIAAWLTHARLLSRGEGDPLGPRILAALSTQARHLARVARRDGDEAPLAAIRGLIYAAACDLLSAGGLKRALSLLRAAIARQILPDGGHVSRSPTDSVEALALLVNIRGMLTIAGADLPPELISAIDTMTPMARFYRHPDGKLALFNG